MIRTPLELGDIVQICNKDCMTYMKIGQVVRNDSNKNDYKLIFEGGWCGYYNKEDLTRQIDWKNAKD